MEDDIIRPQRKEFSKIGPRLTKNKQCKKQRQNSTTIMILASSQMEQEEILKEKKIEKTKKTFGMLSKQNNSEAQQYKIINEDDNNEILFEDNKVHYMEEDEQQMMSDHNSSSGEDDFDNFRDRQYKYNAIYGVDEDINIHSDEVDLSNCLKDHKIPNILRSKMVDWMVEVFGNYRQTSSDKTYFRAVCILDLFYKKCQRKLSESDVHLYGIASMFLATKQEDISHISLDDIVEKVGHKKFSEKKIREAEYEILRVLEFKTDFPTPFTYLTRYIYKTFSYNMNQVVTEISQFSIYILKKCLHDEKLLDYKSHILAFSSFIIALKIYFNLIKGEKTSLQQYEMLQNQEIHIIEQMFQFIPAEEHRCAKNCSTQVKDLYIEFSKIYPDLKNLDRFAN